MTARRTVAVAAVVVFGLACSTLSQAVTPPTATPAPTPTVLPSATFTATLPAPTATPTLTPLPPTPTPIPAAYVPPGCENVPAATVPPATSQAQPTVGLPPNPEIATDEQLRIFDQLVETITQEYLYPDFNGQDWPAISEDNRSRIAAGLDTEAFYTELQGLVTELGDDHSHFESPSAVAASAAELAGNTEFVGVGALILPLPEKGHLSILTVFPNSSAFYGGLQPHDSVLAADGLPLIEDGQVFTQRVRGPECSAVVLTIQSPGGPARNVTFIRNRLNAPQPVDARLVATTDGSRIGYLFVPTFFDQTIPGQIEQALLDFGQLDGLILDNRMNGGGSSTVIDPILAYFTSGTVGHFVSRSASRPLDIQADPVNDSQTVPLVVLVGEDTVSFGEIFSGVLQDIGRARLVGQTTLGNVETLHSFSFEDGSRVWLANERFDPIVSHADWEKDGIHPDVEAYADWDTFTFETDPGVAAAVQLLGHQ